MKAYLNQKIISDIQNHDYAKHLETEQKEAGSESIVFANKAMSDPSYVSDDYNEDRKLVIRAVTDRLKKMNRAVKQDKVEAALIAIMQNQFVVLVGLPGSGKTSFALQFTHAIGASVSTLLVPVAKDWTRPKDLMGYHNPITNSYEPGVTNFVPFYKSLNQFNEDEITNSFLILDEFNLSQPEFYLSNLTGLADNSVSRTINLGHGKDIEIPSTNRFICTANTDETVQSLSARMINRCAFIQFSDLPELEQTVTELTYIKNLTPLLTGTDMVDLFTASDSDVISESLKSEIDQLIAAFREQMEEYGNGISISSRKYIQLLQFCKVMSPEENGQSKVLDYAATFFLLPLVSGSGFLFKERLINIKNISEDLSLEDFSNHIKTIIVEGEENFDHYRFMMA